ncbi:MAG: tetratricopeptide repeat protein [Treponemataceae bacterium]
MKITIRLLPFILLLFFSARFFGQPYSIDQSNRIAAVKLLMQAKTMTENDSWEQAYSSAQLGIQYDSSIADLYFLKALAATHLNMPVQDILQLLARSLDGSKWVHLQKEKARVLYAQFLTQTLDWQKALEVLDEKPIVFSADAEYIRALTYYRQEKIPQARAKIRAARSFFPDDPRFTLLFLKQEYKNDTDLEVLEFISGILSNIFKWIDTEPEIVLYATPFSNSSEERRRFLQAYKAVVEKPVQAFAPFALNYGVILEEEAFELLKSYADEGIDFNYFSSFVSLIHSDAMKKNIQQWLSHFNGIFLFDTNTDGIVDLAGEYKAGRPQKISFDRNQDGECSWIIDCDFGLPSKIMLEKMGKTVIYDHYPSVAAVEVKTSTSFEQYKLATQEFFWTPVNIVAANIYPLEESFFIPEPKLFVDQLTQYALVIHSNSVMVTVDDEKKIFHMSDGKPYSAEYYKNDVWYAQSIFENGILQTRSVDKNNDGYFEVTEFYTFSPEENNIYQSEEDALALRKELFATINSAAGYYISKITLDLNQTGEPDYIEEVLPNGGSIKQWDLDENGVGKIRQIKKVDYPEQEGATAIPVVTEQTDFIHPVTNDMVSVVLIDDVPKEVITSRGKQDVFYDSLQKIYWIGKQFDSTIAAQIIEKVFFETNLGVLLISVSDMRFLVLKTEEYYFIEHFAE